MRPPLEPPGGGPWPWPVLLLAFGLGVGLAGAVVWLLQSGTPGDLAGLASRHAAPFWETLP